MGVDGLELLHVKSHLQKYRLSTRGGGGGGVSAAAAGPGPSRLAPALPDPSEASSAPLHLLPGHDAAAGLTDWTPTSGITPWRGATPGAGGATTPGAGGGSSPPPAPDELRTALAAQLDMQRRLAEQLRAQRSLQASLEAHAAHIATLLQRAASGDALSPRAAATVTAYTGGASGSGIALPGVARPPAPSARGRPRAAPAPPHPPADDGAGAAAADLQYWLDDAALDDIDFGALVGGGDAPPPPPPPGQPPAPLSGPDAAP